jgi:hypothetical protein
MHWAISCAFLCGQGQRHDSVGALDLIDGLTFEALLGDRAFDNNTIREDLDRRGAEAVIPSKADRKQAILMIRINIDGAISSKTISVRSKSSDQ